MLNKSSSELGAVKLVLEELTHEIAAALRPHILSYFDKACGARFLLTSAAKVVARLEVRESGAYLDVSLGRVGEDGKIYCHKALAIEFNQAAPKEMLDEAGFPSVFNTSLTKSQLKELRLQAKNPQPMHGRRSSKVQNFLVGTGLSTYSYSPDGTLCSVTNLGMLYLALHPVNRARRKP